MEITEQQETLLVRAVEALEQLARDPVIEIESGPPICPSCNRVNPVVDVFEGGGRGRLYEAFTVAECSGCHQKLYIVPMHMEIFTDLNELQLEIEKRKGGNNGN